MAVLKYTLLRLGVFAVVFVACAQLSLGRFTLLYALVIGLLVSWAVGYLFFNRWRLAAGAQIAGVVGNRGVGRGETDDNAAEDALAEHYHDGDPR